MMARTLSLKNLLVVQFVLGAMIPTLLLSSLLISAFRTIQADEQIKKAQGIIRAALIGLIITLGAYGITAFVVPRVLDSTVAFDVFERLRFLA